MITLIIRRDAPLFDSGKRAEKLAEIVTDDALEWLHAHVGEYDPEPGNVRLCDPAPLIAPGTWDIIWPEGVPEGKGMSQVDLDSYVAVRLGFGDTIRAVEFKLRWG